MSDKGLSQHRYPVKFAYIIVSVLLTACNGYKEIKEEQVSDKTESGTLIPIKAIINYDSVTTKDYKEWYYSSVSGMVSMKNVLGGKCTLVIKNRVIRALEDGCKMHKVNNLDKLYPDIICYFKIDVNNDSFLENFNYGTDKMNYFAFDAEQDFLLITGKDSLRPSLFHYENVYPHAPYFSFIVEYPFENIPDSGFSSFVFSGFKNEKFEYSIPNSTLKRTPKFTDI